MTLVQMPDGTYAEIEEGTPPEVIEVIRAQHMPRGQEGGGNQPPLTPGDRLTVARDDPNLSGSQRGFVGGTMRDQPWRGGSINNLIEDIERGFISMDQVQRGLREGTLDPRATEIALQQTGHAAPGAFESATNSLVHGLTFGLSDEIRGGVGALTGRGYSAERNRQNRVLETGSAENPTASMIGNITGALVNPVGTGAKGLQALGGAGSRLANLGLRIERAPMPLQATIAGANYGALSGAGNAEDGERLAGAGVGGVEGAIGGLLFGGAVHGARRGWQAIRDTKPAAAGRIAYARIAEALSGQPRPGKAGMRYTPEAAARELSVANARGTDAIAADLSPGLQAMAARAARRPEIPASNQLIAQSEARAAARPAAMEQQIAQRFEDVGTGTNATAAGAANTAARRGQGAADYDDVLNRQMVWNDDLEAFFTKNNPHVKEALNSAARTVRGQDIDPTQLGFKFNKAGDVEYIRVPNMRTFDYIKRGFDEKISAALRTGSRDEARIFSQQLDLLKTAIGRSNKDYLAVLAKQRDFFQRDEALELGQSVIPRLTGARAEPRLLLDDIRKVKPEDMEMVRTGFADRLMALRDQRTAGRGPVAVLQSMLKSPNQRKALEALFGGRGNLGRFERWLGRELRASKTDAMVSGPQSITSLMQGVPDVTGAAGVGAAAARGYGFGGPVGAASNAMRSLTDMARNVTTTRPVQEEIARILMGRGDDLVPGIRSAQQFNLNRTNRNRRAATGTAKAIAALLTSQGG